MFCRFIDQFDINQLFLQLFIVTGVVGILAAIFVKIADKSNDSDSLPIVGSSAPGNNPNYNSLAAQNEVLDEKKNITGWVLLSNPLFWQIFFAFFFITGTYIYKHI